MEDGHLKTDSTNNTRSGVWVFYILLCR
jgi:hypothetical protein